TGCKVSGVTTAGERSGLPDTMACSGIVCTPLITPLRLPTQRAVKLLLPSAWNWMSGPLGITLGAVPLSPPLTVPKEEVPKPAPAVTGAGPDPKGGIPDMGFGLSANAADGLTAKKGSVSVLLNEIDRRFGSSAPAGVVTLGMLTPSGSGKKGLFI